MRGYLSAGALEHDRPQKPVRVAGFEDPQSEQAEHGDQGGANITDLGEEHGHRVLKVRGKGGKVVLTPLPPAVQRAIERAVDGRTDGPILRNLRAVRMDRHAATRRLKDLAADAGVTLARMHPHTSSPPTWPPAPDGEGSPTGCVLS